MTIRLYAVDGVHYHHYLFFRCVKMSHTVKQRLSEERLCLHELVVHQ